MDEFEILRVIGLIDRIRQDFRGQMEVYDDDAIWKAVSFLIGRHLRGQVVTLSALCEALELPYATARRVAIGLIERGLILKVPSAGRRRSFELHPSPALLHNFKSYVRNVKKTLAGVLGSSQGAEGPDDYYFGGGASAKSKRSIFDGIKFLFYSDHYSHAIRNNWSDFRTRFGSAKCPSSGISGQLSV